MKAYFLLIWSSTDSMEMWKLGNRMLPRIPSSFSSGDRQNTKQEVQESEDLRGDLRGDLRETWGEPEGDLRRT